MDDPLTIRELQDLLEISSPSVVYHHIQQLEKKGYLKRNPHNPKDYQILTEPEKPIVYLNLYGLAHCGPEGSLLDGDPKDRIPIASRLLSFPADEAFLVEAKGDSMEPRIKEGDLVIAKRTQVPDNGDTVVCVYKGDAIIKQFYQKDDHIILQSENSKYAPIVASEVEVRVEGVVKGVIQLN
jgi:repressor LexA